MAIALRHPITAKVDDRASFLRSIMEEYPMFLKEWESKTEKEFSKLAQENSGGDRNVESSIYSSLCSIFDDNAEKTNMFYQSLFLMCYSYYESCIALLGKKANPKETIKAICSSNKISLSEDSQEVVDYLQGDINTLRNNICHNNFGTYRKTESLKRLSQQNIGIYYDEMTETIFFTDFQIINEVLNKMHKVLSELCDKLGYKTRFIGK